MKKRILSCLMALALCLTLLPSAALAEEPEGTAQTPSAVEKAADPANGEAKQENQSAAPEREGQSAEQEEQQEDSASKQAVAAVQAMIDALPDAAELDGMDDAARESACFAASEAYEAYDALTEEQQSALTGAEKMIAILKWSNEQVALAANEDLSSHTNHDDWTAISTEADLTGITAAGYYYLTKDVTIGNTWIPVDGVTLCLNGNSITATGKFNAITIQDGRTFTLCDCKVGQTGKVTHGKDANNATFTGCGVYVNGTFNMYGGSIAGNTVATKGGGVTVEGGTFNMYGGTISGNNSVDGGGVYLNTAMDAGMKYKATFNMYGGTISDNTAKYGGGVYVNSSTFTMTGSACIAHNKAMIGNSGNGGGVYVWIDANFDMNGGTISDNSGEYGGGVYVGRSATKFTMTNGSITRNTAKYGGGVWTGSDFTVSGDVNITDNTPDNVYLSGTKIIIGEKGLNPEAKIGVTKSVVNEGDKFVTVATLDAGVTYTPGNIFSDRGDPSGVLLEDGKVNLYSAMPHKHPICGAVHKDINGHTGACAAVNWTPWDGTSPITYNSEKTAYVYLTANAERDSALTVADGHKLYLCLNGNEIEMTSAGDVISVNDGGTLTLTDCQSTGAVRHDFSSHPGHGVVIRAGGTFSLYNAKIQYNQGSMEGRNDSAGAGVYMGGGKFHMYSGSIRENEALRNGGGVYMDGGEFTMYGGTIEENTATDSNSGVYGDGGGVYINGGKFTMTGGSITKNTALNFAGVCVANGNGTFTVSGKVTVTGNWVGQTENNVYLYKDKLITIGEGGLDVSAKIGVTCRSLNSGESVTIATGGAYSCTESNFIANAGGAHFIKVEQDADTSNVNVKLYNGQPPVETHKHYLCGGSDGCTCTSGSNCESVNFTAWDSANALPDTAGNYYLTKDVELDGSSNIPWMPKADTVLCLNGHKITKNGGGDVIYVLQNVTFTLCDCKGGKPAYGQITHAEGQTGGGVMVKGGTFYMYGGSITQNKTSNGKCGGGVYMEGGKFYLYGGEITGNEAAMGGGVYMGNSSTFEMTGGSITKNKISNGGGGVFALGAFTMNGGEISGNTVKATSGGASADGGGVYVGTSGTFTMNGGAKIANNTVDHNGGGVYVFGQGRFNMTGGTIGGTKSGEANTANYGGGVYADSIGAINMTSGEISGNEATQDGGGVYVNKGMFTMNGGGIAKNTAASAGGGVFARLNGTFTMNGGEISGGNNAAEGGGVYASGTFTMNGGEISGSNATTGGGVYVYGEFNMSGGKIRVNAADEKGGGVYVDPNGMFTVSGSVTVLENTKNGGANNVYLVSRSNSITIGDGRLGEGARIGVTTASEPAEEAITIATNARSGDEKCFVSDAADPYQTDFDNGTVVLKKSAPTGHTHCLCGETHKLIGDHETDTQTEFIPWSNMTKLPSAAGCYYLTEDVTLARTWAPVSGTVLCLNGHSITMTNSDDAIHIINNATFTLTDCQGTGRITHAEEKTHCGVRVSNGTFYMYGGVITQNEGTAPGGGGVHVYYNENGRVNTFYMYGGTITGNRAEYGGGVYVNSGPEAGQDGTFHMYGGEISGNRAAKNGGGVFVYGNFTVSGSANITGNTAGGEKNNMYLVETKRPIAIGKGGLTDGASIGVTTEKAPDRIDPVVFAIFAKEPDMNRFTSDKEGIEVQFREEDGKLMLVKKDASAGHSGAHCICGTRHGSGVGDHTVKKIISDWTGVDSLDQITSAGYYFLKQNVELDAPWTPANGTVLCLNGFNITANGNFNAITVNNGAVFTLTDCQGLQSIAYGKITHASGTYGRGVEVENGTFNLYKGEITGNGGEVIGEKSHLGGGVKVTAGTFNMYGGSITGNIGGGYCLGGGVYVAGPSSTFNLYSGEISGNWASFGGGVEVCGAFNMSGGEITTNNRANYGGGVEVRGSTAAFNMSGGSITNNTASCNGASEGGGVLVYGGTFTVSGSANITGNTANNVYLYDGKTIAIGEGGLSGTIGVTTKTKPAENKPVTVIADTKGIAGLTNHVVSDDNAYKTAAVDGSAIVLRVKGDGGETPAEHTHKWIYTATGATITATCEGDGLCNFNNDGGSVTIKAPTNLTYDGKVKHVTVERSGNWRSAFPEDIAISYHKFTGGSYAEMGEGPTVVGKYKAITTVNGATAFVEYEITGGTTPSQPSNPGGSTGSGGSSSDRDSSDSNPIIKTETKNNADGSTTKTETRRDGSVTQTTTGKDGGVSKTETKKDGSSVTENKAADGSTGTVKTDKNGQTEAKTVLSDKAIEDAKKNGEAVKAPVEVEASRNSSTAPTVKVELPKGAGETKVEIPVSNVKPGTVAVIVHPDGTEEILKNSIPTEDGIQLTVDGSATVKIVDNSKGFIDTRNHWAEDEIDFVSARGLVNGMSDTIYAPNNSTTRAQLWTILARQNDANLNGGSVWYEKAQNWAKDKGVSDDANPNAAINRAQMVTMLWRAVGQPAPATAATFTDVSADAYYAGAVSWAVENGITTGVGGGKFDPTGACTRAQIAAFLTRLYAEK